MAKKKKSKAKTKAKQSTRRAKCRKLQYHDHKSQKFWSIELVGKKHTVHFGRVGTDGQTRTKQFDCIEDAQNSFDKLIAQKLKKGYKDADSSKSKKTKSVAKKRRSTGKARTSQLLNRLEKWLARNLPEVLESMNPGATDKQIDRYEKSLGYELPEDVRAWFRWHDGQRRFPDKTFLFGYELLSLKDSLEAWKRWKEIGETDPILNEQVAELSSSRPSDAIIANYSMPGWIPLAQSPAISNYLGIDLNPGPAGTSGQVINFGRDDHDKCVAGRSLGDFLEFFVEELRSGRVISNLEQGVEGHSYFFSYDGTCSHILNVLIDLHDLGKFDGRRHHIDDTIPHVDPLTPERLQMVRELHVAARNVNSRPVSAVKLIRSILEQDPELLQYEGSITRVSHGSALTKLGAILAEFKPKKGRNRRSSNSS